MVKNLEKIVEICKNKRIDGGICEYTKKYDYVSCPYINNKGNCEYNDKIEIELGKYKNFLNK